MCAGFMHETHRCCSSGTETREAEGPKGRGARGRGAERPRGRMAEGPTCPPECEARRWRGRGPRAEGPTCPPECEARRWRGREGEGRRALARRSEGCSPPP